MIKPNPTSKRKTSGSDGHSGLYCLLRKLAPQCTIGLNFKKFTHLRMAVLMRGGSWKRNDHWLFCMAKVGMDIVPERRQCLNQRIFYFIEQRQTINYMRCLRSHGMYQHQQQFCTERKESLSVRFDYTVLNKWESKNAWRWRSWLLYVMMRHF